MASMAIAATGAASMRIRMVVIWSMAPIYPPGGGCALTGHNTAPNNQPLSRRPEFAFNGGDPSERNDRDLPTSHIRLCISTLAFAPP